MTSVPALRRWSAGLAAACALSLPAGAASAADAGLVARTSRWSVDETVEKIVAGATARGLTLFATIDHAANARTVGLSLRPTVVLLLGNPKGGTPVMVAAPSAAIDLPLKVLVAEDASGTTVVTTDDPAFVQQRHGIPSTLAPAVSALGPLLDAALR